MSEETKTALNLGKVGLTQAEIEEMKQDITGQLGGVRLGYNEEGKPGYYTTDETGADTVIPFSSSGAGGKLSFDTLTLVAYALYSSYIYSYKTTIRMDAAQYKKMTISSGTLLARATNSTTANKSVITISGYNEGQSQKILFISETGQTKSLNPGINQTITAKEINIEDYSEITIELGVSAINGIGYATLNGLTLE